MSKSNGASLFGRRSGTVTVIEDQVRRSSVRSAKAAFWVCWIVAGSIAGAVAADYWPPVAAFLIGALVGLAVATPVAVVVLVWPVLRVIWWWLPEIGTVLVVLVGWVNLAGHTSLPVRLALVAGIVGVLAGVPQARRWIVALAWCQISRHRLRCCFSQFIITNRTGSLPLILWAQPIPVGERVWVWLRPGLSQADLEGRLDRIATGCWAATVTVERASDSTAALVRFDIKRRDPLTRTVSSPLVGLVEPVPIEASDDTDGTISGETTVALDLPEVTDAVTRVPAPRRPDKKATETRSSDSGPGVPSGVTASDGEDISDWID